MELDGWSSFKDSNKRVMNCRKRTTPLRTQRKNDSQICNLLARARACCVCECVCVSVCMCVCVFEPEKGSPKSVWKNTDGIMDSFRVAGFEGNSVMVQFSRANKIHLLGGR